MKVLVPIEPPELMWGGLARDIVMFLQLDGRHSGNALHEHLENLGTDIPAWLLKEIPNNNNVPPKGTFVVCIYKACLEDYGVMPK